MRFSFSFITLFFFLFINISSSKAFISFHTVFKKQYINNNIHLINDPKIGIVDFRNILKESLTMKKLGKEFLKFERKLNDKIKKQEKILRNKELKLSLNKNKISDKSFNIEKNKLKKEITKFQKFAFSEKKRVKFIISINSKKT